MVRIMDTRLDASRLESLLESAKLLGSSLKLEDQLSHILRTIMGRLLTMRAAVAINGPRGMRVEVVRGVQGLQKGAPFSEEIAQQAGLPIVAPIGDPEAPQGMIGVGRPARGEMDEAERDFLSALLNLAATSIANARAHEEVVRSNQGLRAVLDLGRGIASTIDPEEVAQIALLTLSGRMAARKYALITWRPGQEPVRRVRGIEGVDAEELQKRFGEAWEIEQADGYVYVPIRQGETTAGVVILGPRIGDAEYTEQDLDFCAGIVAQAAVALENAWRVRDTLYRKQLEKELSLAASIQKDLFPQTMPPLRATALAARNRQAREVGGDYYDALPFGPAGADTPHLLTVADISGKGIAASLLMANIQATLRALLATQDSLPLIAARMSDLLYASTPASKYATAILVRYDPVSGECEYVNGGHNEGVVLRASGEVELLRATGLPVGLMPARTFESAGFEMGAGDLLLIYSDGVPDACTLEDEEFGLDRTIECLKATRHLPPEEILDRLFAAIDDFVGAAPQHDDITAMVVKRQEPGHPDTE